MPRLRIPPPPPIGPVAGSALALAAVAVVFGVQLLLGSHVWSAPFALFFVAVFAAAWLGGYPGGLLATALSAALGNYFFLAPRWAFSTDASGLVATAIFGAVAVLMTFLSSALHAGYRERERLQSEALRARDVFLSVASHELKTPITVAQLHMQRLRRQIRRGRLDPERLGPLVESTAASVERMGALVEALLDVSRLATGRLVTERLPVDLSALVIEASARLTETARQRGSELRLEVEPGVRGMGDRLRIDQVVTNLVMNAIKYGGGAPIVVRLTRDAARATLTVSDHGIGVAPGDLARIFERFERAANARQHGGLGLGLWISREIVQASGGTIAVASAPGEGATFTVELPVGAISSVA